MAKLSRLNIFSKSARDGGGRTSREKTSKYADYVPVAGLILGFALIFLGWNGAASVDYTQGQIPYMISGGLIGLGIVFFSSAALLVQAIKKGLSRQEAELRSLNRTMERLASSISFSANGHKEDADLVVAGATSFHLPECRMVGTRGDLVKVTRDEALAEGLEPCRICKP